VKEVITLLKGHPVLFAFAGGFTEGAVTIFLCGVFSRLGYFPLVPTLIASYLGTALSYQLFFLIGRFLKEKLLYHFPKVEEEFEKVEEFYGKDFDYLSLAVPFIYGMGVVIPLFLGVNGYSWLRFTLLSCASSIVWVALCFWVGYFVGDFSLKLFKEVMRQELLLFLLLVTFAAVSHKLFKFTKGSVSRGKAKRLH